MNKEDILQTILSILLIIVSLWNFGLSIINKDLTDKINTSCICMEE